MSSAPYSAALRGVYVRPLEDGYYYAFNFDEPNGVKLLSGSTARRLLGIVSSCDGVPELEEYVIPEDRALASHKLLFMKSDPTLYRSRRPLTEKSFNVWLHVINGCNFKCFYCYVPHLQSHIDPAAIAGHSMSTDTAQSVIECLLAFCRLNGFQRLHIKFAGGEPTLNLSLVESFCQ